MTDPARGPTTEELRARALAQSDAPQTPQPSDRSYGVAKKARAFVSALDKYEADLLGWHDVVPFLNALRRATAALDERRAEHLGSAL